MFLTSDPQQLIYTHFPEENEWQLLDRTKSIKEFETMAYLMDRFFNLEMRVLSHPNCNIESSDGEIDILFGLHPEKSVNHMFLCIPTVFDEKNQISTPVEVPQQNVQLDFIHRPNEKVLSVKVRFPAVDMYKLEIVGKDLTVTQSDYDFEWVAIYKVNCTGIPPKQTFFPIVEAAGWGPGKLLEEFGLAALTHSNGVIRMHPGPLEVKFKITDKKKAEALNLVYKMLPIGKDESSGISTEPFKKSGEILEAITHVEPGEFKMKISHMFGEGELKNFKQT